MTLPLQPSSIINRAIDQLPGAKIIGSLDDGTTESEAARRIYGATLRQLLRAAHWSFGRKNAPLLLLGDSSGLTLAPNGQPYSNLVELPWLYAYAWPTDGVRARWLPMQWGATVNGPPIPIMPNLGPGTPFAAPQPARFLVSSSDQFPVVTGKVDWDNLPDFGEGAALTSRHIILTNVQNASLVYTRLVLEIEMWDTLFEEAMVATLASRLAIPLIPDKKLAITLRGQQIAIAKDAVGQARMANANEMGFPQSTDHTPDWIRARSGGAGYANGWGGGDGPGVLRYGWAPMAWGDGSVF